jgi:phage terminase small subunit
MKAKRKQAINRKALPNLSQTTADEAIEGEVISASASGDQGDDARPDWLRASGSLSLADEAFCAAYVSNGYSPISAALAVFPGSRTRNAGAMRSRRLMERPEIKARIAELHAHEMVRKQMTADRVVTELSWIGKSDPRRLFNDKGGLRDPKDWPDDIAACIASIETEELFAGTGEDREQIGFTKKVKFWSKPEALKLLGEHFNLFQGGASGAVLVVNIRL